MFVCADLFGFNNRTCSTSLSPRTTAGPVMRTESKSELWYDWLFRVIPEHTTEDGSKVVTMRAFVDPDVQGDAKCLGYLSTFYDNPEYSPACFLPPYGDGLFLNATGSSSKTNSQAWIVRQTGQDGVFEVIASNKPDVCARALAVKECNAQPVLAEYPVTDSTEKIYTSWKLVKKYDLVPAASPPPPSPLPSPPPPQGTADQPSMQYPGPVISSPSSSTLPYVNVIVNVVGGNAFCSVDSISITSRASSVGSVPQNVEVPTSTPGLSTVGVRAPLKEFGYNTIFAIGRCSSGETTEMSNQLAVFYSSPSGVSPSLPSPSPPPPPPPPSFRIIGNAGFSAGGASDTRLAIDSADRPYVAYRDAANGQKATVMKFDGTNWVTVGTAGFSLGVVLYLSFALDSLDTPYVAFQDEGNGQKATVMKFDGTNWVTLGNVSDSSGWHTSLAIDSADIPYVGFWDGTSGNPTIVKKFVSNAWTVVGTPGFTDGQADYLSLTLSPSDTPYLAYRSVKVYKYTDSWNIVGTSAFDNRDTYPSIAVDSSDTPYVAYNDGSHGKGATVVKFDGTNWVTVGTAEFSAGEIKAPSLALDSSDVPYVTFQDVGAGDKVVLLKFDGTDWVAAGPTLDVFSGKAYSPSLALDSSDTAFVAYSADDSYKVTVVKLGY